MTDAPATEKQKAYLRVLAQQNETQIPHLHDMNIAQATSEIEYPKEKNAYRRYKQAKAEKTNWGRCLSNL
jgi:hypothetical protein